MKLVEALQTLRAPAPPGAPLRVGLATSFTPLHLLTFLKAELVRRRPSGPVDVETGAYGDASTLLTRAGSFDAIVLVVEWPDLDARLGLRSLGSWEPAALPDIRTTAMRRLEALRRLATRAAEDTALVVVPPTLPLPPAAFEPPGFLSGLAAGLRAAVAAWEESLAGARGVTVLDGQSLALQSPLASRLDARSEVVADFPYTPEHAAVVGALAAEIVIPAAPKKGLITDLDETLWSGIVGEDGVDSISWSLDAGTHAHAIYQRMLLSLGGAGVLIAAASRNSPEVVAEALSRPDLLLPRERVFPIEANWEPKSASVSRILRAWNVAASAVVFVDDSPSELAEVEAVHAGITTLRFPGNDPAAVHALVVRLRELFGKDAVGPEDGLRMASLRQAAGFEQEAAGSDQDAFLADAEAVVGFSPITDDTDPRPLQLVLKTNQFNLNGRRFTDGEWKKLVAGVGRTTLLVSYEDRFGPLGKIAVLSGTRNDDRFLVDVWVMSCRAFARRIEDRCLQHLFDTLGVGELAFDLRRTDKNVVLRDFLGRYVPAPADGTIFLTHERFRSLAPALFHRVTKAA